MSQEFSGGTAPDLHQMQYHTLNNSHDSTNILPLHSNPQQILMSSNENNNQQDHLLPEHNVSNSLTGNISERCRFCGEQLPMDALLVVSHFNSHWRQFNLESSSSSCTYQNHSDTRLNNLNFLQSSDELNSPNITGHLTNNNNNNVIVNPSEISLNNGFPFHYSPQNEQSNLPSQTNSPKCSDNEDNNDCMRLPIASCNEVQQTPADVSQQIINRALENINIKDSPTQTSTMNCHNVLNMQDASLQVACSRSSPLNLTGRPKDNESSSVLNRISITNSPDSNTASSIEDTCAMSVSSNLHQETMPLNSSTSLTHPLISNIHPANASFSTSFPSNNYSSHFPYTATPMMQSELPSCRLQNFSHNLENIGLSIPILSPNLASIHADQPNGCLMQSRPTIETNEEIQHESNLALDNSNGIPIQCSLQNANAHTNDISYSANCSPEIRVSDNDKEPASRKGTTINLPQYHCITCGKTFTSEIMYDNHISSHLSNSNARAASPNVGSTSMNYSMGCSANVGNNNSGLTSCSGSSNSTSAVFSSCCISANPLSKSYVPICVVKPYKCSICNEEFDIKERLHKHIEDHEAAKPFHCDLCGVGVSNQRALKRHKLTHTGYKPYKCSTCGKCFLQKHDLSRHMSVHDRPKYFTCNHCKRSFTATSSYKAHKCKGSKEMRPFLCHICGDGCSNRLAWSYHMWKHTKNPKFVPFQDNVSSVCNL